MNHLHSSLLCANTQHREHYVWQEKHDFCILDERPKWMLLVLSLFILLTVCIQWVQTGGHLAACFYRHYQQRNRCGEEPHDASSPCTSQWSSQSRWATSYRGSPPHRRGLSTSEELTIEISNICSRYMPGSCNILYILYKLVQMCFILSGVSIFLKGTPTYEIIKAPTA